ncbi:hypothetical protein D3H35_21770 [Cohnella faecalis]|uniref:Arginyl tRNA synthetase N-terminal domain-containing protein n=1 Tax=Cohnella faecalis TaxID=2315694 RepID=A0A398CNA4_9BACL|nr:hypothetical protein D3H35_21770 [Cohnella faecalis]
MIAHLDKSRRVIQSAEIAGPGFINFRLDKSYLYPLSRRFCSKGALWLGCGWRRPVRPG